MFIYSSDKITEAQIKRLLLKFSQDVGLGMQYLSGKGYVHRDLAARNVVIRNKVCKVP